MSAASDTRARLIATVLAAALTCLATVATQAQPMPHAGPYAVLYEEDPSLPQGRSSPGSVVWHFESPKREAGARADAAVRADVQVPSRGIAVRWVLRRNVDQTLPASHTIDLAFTLAPDFASGGIANVPGILMKSTAQARGVPLTGITVKVAAEHFLIGLSAVDVERNTMLLIKDGWISIPLVYADKHRAILAVQKGAPGTIALLGAFAAWRNQ